MRSEDQNRFDRQYQKHLTALKLHDLADSTCDAYARAVRRVAAAFDRCPDEISDEQYHQHFLSLIDLHSWSTVRLDLAGLTFFFRHTLQQPWQGAKIVRPKAVC